MFIQEPGVSLEKMCLCASNSMCSLSLRVMCRIVTVSETHWGSLNPKRKYTTIDRRSLIRIEVQKGKSEGLGSLVVRAFEERTQLVHVFTFSGRQEAAKGLSETMVGANEYGL